jgi:hypothetical protein
VCKLCRVLVWHSSKHRHNHRDMCLSSSITRVTLMHTYMHIHRAVPHSRHCRRRSSQLYPYTDPLLNTNSREGVNCKPTTYHWNIDVPVRGRSVTIHQCNLEDIHNYSLVARLRIWRMASNHSLSFRHIHSRL